MSKLQAPQHSVCSWEGHVIISFLPMRELKHSEAKRLVQGHILLWWPPGCSSPRPGAAFPVGCDPDVLLLLSVLVGLRLLVARALETWEGSLPPALHVLWLVASSRSVPVLPMVHSFPLTWLQVSQLPGESCTILAAAGPHLTIQAAFSLSFTLSLALTCQFGALPGERRSQDLWGEWVRGEKQTNNELIQPKMLLVEMGQRTPKSGILPFHTALPSNSS